VSERILITGAGSGLGKAMATRYAAAGWRVLVTDVDAVAAETVAKELDADFLAIDVTDDASWTAAREWCEERWGGLDVLVNNAGVASGGRIEKIPMADWDWIWEINLKGVVRGCRTFVPLFKAQGSGHLVNIASLAGIMNLPGMASYNVTKAGVISLSQTLRYELEPNGIGITVVCPAFVQTNLNDSMRTPDPVALKVSKKLMAASKVTPEDVARQVFDAVADERFLVHTHTDGKRAQFLKRFAPRLIDKQVAKYWARMRPAMEKESP
jgi:NADP-dependent 3-hydroxy acid dehydrogenase YdfG